LSQIQNISTSIIMKDIELFNLLPKLQRFLKIIFIQF
jgi:hypothetical protein